MIDKTNNNDIGLRYSSPKVNVIEMEVQGVFCGSLDGTPSNIPWTPGSDSAYGFGDDEDD